jgi:DNA helicase-2/ATP-dependent DNA helicase PcrA
VPSLDPDALLVGLDPEQREAVLAVGGPVVILAGAGSGKTRVISRRTAYAIATGAVPPDQVLVVTFTEKAAGEMVERLRGLGLPGVTARTFHAHALRQLRHFWPELHGGAAIPELLDSKLQIVGRLARQLPGHYRFTPSKDLADEIEWAKTRRIAPKGYAAAATAAKREPPVPVDLFVRTYEGYERAKKRANRIDFDDLLVETVALLEANDAAVATVRARKSWFAVDEYQDTNPLQERLLELWVGDRRDVCVVGDEDQSIYTFTGASPEYLRTFAARWPGAREISLVRNYRSTPQVLELANRLIEADGREKGLVATRPDGPAPVVAKHASAEAELAALCTWIRVRLGEGIVPAEIAVLVRMNAQLASIEEALTRAGIAYQVRGIRFYDRPEVRGAIDALRKPRLEAVGGDLVEAVRERWIETVGYEEEPASSEGDEGRERQASLETLLAIVETVVDADAKADAAGVVAELEARAANEREGAADGVNLLTYHRAKGLEWDAVFLPALEEGTLPIRQAVDDEAALEEERRLLYVGITRARLHLVLSWAERRDTRGRESKRRPSRFLLDVRPRPARPGTRVKVLQGPPPQVRPPRPGASDDPFFAALREWRLGRADAEGVPAYIVAHDDTLKAIADVRPRTLSGLARVRGMGPARVDKYGVEILEIVERTLAAGR